MKEFNVNNIDRRNWKKFQFEEIAFSISERVEPKDTDLEIYVGLEHLDPGTIHIKRTGTPNDVEGTKLRVYKGDIIFGRRRAYQRKAAIANFDGICSAHALVLRAKKDVIDPKLFPFFLHSDYFMHKAIDISVGSLSPTINWGTLKSQEFFLPPREQQAKLAELLWAGDVVVEKYKNVYQKTQTLISSYTNQIFGKDDLITKGILEIAEVKRGRFSHRPRNEPRFFGGDIPFIQTSEVVEAKKYIETFGQTLNAEGLKVSKMFPEETIVMVIAGTYIGSVGLLKFNSAFTDSLVGITSFNDRILQKYLFYYLKFHEKQIDTLATEVAQRNLSIDGFQEFKVRFPKLLSEQKEVVASIEDIEFVLNGIQASYFTVMKIQSQLINKIFSS